MTTLVPVYPEQEYFDPNAGMYADKVPYGNIGDVTSSERGSGARYSAGKMPLQLIPMQVLLIEAHSTTLQAVGTYMALFEKGENAASAIKEALRFIPEKHRWASTAAVFEYGARKYAAWNWAKGMPWSAVLACAKRHWLALAMGEELDAESGLSHWGHLGCNIVMLIHYVDHYPEGDDRPPANIWAQKEAKQ